LNGKVSTIDIPLLVVGVDYKSACSAYRGDLISAASDRKDLYSYLTNTDSSAGLIVLETCNRVEWIISCNEVAWVSELLSAKMISLWKETRPGLKTYPAPYIHLGKDAARHIFRLVSGLESFVPGEGQIAGQFHGALDIARKEKTTSIVLNGLSGIAGRAAKFSNRTGFRSNHGKGVHVLTLRFIENYFNHGYDGTRIGVAGMGEIGRKSASLIEETLKTNVIKMNRTIPEKNKKVWKPLESLPDISRELDVLVVATGSKDPVIAPEDITVSARKEPLLILDIGIPNQVAPRIEQDGMIEYRNIDDLMSMNLDTVNQKAVEELEREIDKYVAQFRRFCIEKDMVLLLDRTRRRHYEFTGNQIPHFIQSNLGGLDETARKKVEYELKGLFRDYTNDVFDSIHAAMEDYWSKKQE